MTIMPRSTIIIGVSLAAWVLAVAAALPPEDPIFEDGFEAKFASFCTDCHGMGTNPAPPPDTTGNNSTSAPGVGAHSSHLGSSFWHAEVLCTDCHLVPTALNDTGHVDSLLPAEITWGDLATADGASPSWNGTTCFGSYCHGETLPPSGSNTTPSWTVVDGSQVTCGTCHGVPPGAPHIQLTDCSSCHPNMDAAGNFTDPTTHVDGVVDLNAF